MTEHTNAPALRFPEFRDEWNQNKLSDVVNVYDGTHQTPKYTNEGIKFLSVENIKTLNSNKYISKEDFIKEFKIHPEYGDILMTRIGDIGTPNIVNLKEPLAYYVSLALLKPININSYFLNSLILSPTVQNELWRKTLHIAFPKKINKNEIAKVLINYPTFNEQEKIGYFFSKLDRQIELEEEKLELLEQQKKGYMQKIFTQELKFENSQLENIKWSYKTLEELNSFFTDGNYGESYPKSEDMSDKNDGVAFLRGSNLKKGRITLEDANYISKKKHSELTTGHLFLDDIVIAVRGSLGAVGYVNENMVGNNINSQLAIIRTSSSLLYGKYLLYYLMSNQGKKELLSRVTGTALKQLPIKQIKQIKVPVPKLHEQHKIANFLSELDNLIDNQTEKMEILKQRKQGLLQKMFV
ncbi:restriction endonuclease subunit S [Staphylococcus borealis]|uniref:restriction endonuclease subunit S n=1 Tax=Staphylococcus borealis TaxID=2742203 RepID=UPI00211BEB8E|nr:restriction endonuclease subunit S [Staphylococcus borealis]MCQ9278864.1 restriction endonuclease subunit S [Staphylococcus borealis]MDM7881657.1 restriction endonuclease subunit S [Staphylococcus borealis]